VKRFAPSLWPLLVAVLSLAITGWLWNHERQTQQRALRYNFDIGLRQTAARIDERVASYEQMLRGVRGLFDASDEVTAADFASYVDTLTAGAGFAGLRTIAYAPLLTPDRVAAHERAQRQAGVVDYTVHPPASQGPVAPVTFADPVPGPIVKALGNDLLAEPTRRAAMEQAGDSGSLTVTQRLFSEDPQDPAADAGFLLFLPLYRPGAPLDTVMHRRAALVGWVFASFRIGELMSSLYGEGTPGLDVRVHDGVEVRDDTRLYPKLASAGPPHAARFEAQEYVGFAGHTWTLSVRSTPAFEQRYSNDSARIIAIAGTGLSLALALLTWQLVTGRERAHATARAMTAQLRDSSERYRRIVETADEGIWMVDADGRTTFVNPKLTQLLGYRADELLDRRWFDFMDEAGRAALDNPAHDPPAAGHAEHLDLRFLRHDGSDLWATLSTSPILDEAGHYTGALAMVTDVTEHKRSEANRALLENQLRQSQKMEAIGTLAGGIAHDFNNIVAAILGNAALAAQDLGEQHPAAAHLAQIRQAGERGRSLVQQIVAFSRQQPQERVVQPLRPLLEEAVRLLRSTLPAGVELELRLSDAPLHINADATQLQQVLMNLCANAWHAMPANVGRIVIGLEAVTLDAAATERLGRLTPGRHIHLWVSDNGSGMDEATRARIFEPFFTTKPVGKGTGLGLSVVHGIVQLHGGAITVHSTPGEGSSFDMYFPLAATVTPPPASTTPAPPPTGRGQHVLYVDDDPVMGILVEALLQRAGYRVTCLDDPRAALARAGTADDAIDLVVTDFNMPELSGLDIAMALQRSRPGLPVVITTGYVTENLRAQAHRAGVCELLQKEYTLEQLVSVVHRTLDETAA
jgi:PAS domain S-box-containing protein